MRQLFKSSLADKRPPQGSDSDEFVAAPSVLSFAVARMCVCMSGPLRFCSAGRFCYVSTHASCTHERGVRARKAQRSARLEHVQ